MDRKIPYGMIVLALLWGCIPDPTVSPCDTNEQCVAGMECGEYHICEPELLSVVLANSSGGGGQSGAAGGPTGGFGESRGVTTAGSDAAVVDEEASFSGSDMVGLGGESTADAGLESLVIVVASITSILCSEQSFEVQLDLQGAESEGFQWTIEPQQNVEAEVVGEANWAQLKVTISQSGEYKLEVRVKSLQQQAEVSIPLDVHQSPRITRDALPPVCPNELYQVQLNDYAEGGVVENYQWGVGSEFENHPEYDREYEELEGSLLGGRYLSPAPDDIVVSKLTVELTDGTCSTSRSLERRQMAQGSEKCPQLVTLFDGQDELPPPCLHSDYVVPLRDKRPVSTSLLWEPVDSFSAGLFFDFEAQAVKGVPTQSGEIVLRVTDLAQEVPRTIETHFDVTAREKCWFAYLAGSDGQRSLNLFDARLREQDSARRSFPEEPLAAGVDDFKFSPGGRFLAYRLHELEGPSTLRLLDLRSWQDLPLSEIDGSVGEYAWSVQGSLDSVTLAVAYVDSSDRGFLGGVNISGKWDVDAAESSDLIGEQAGLIYLVPQPSEVVTQLVWFEANRLAYSSQYEPVPGIVRHRSASAVLLPTPSFRVNPAGGRSFSSQQILPNQAGFFSAAGPNYLDFRARDSTDVVRHSIGSLVSPTGHRVARAHDGNLEVFRPSTSSSDESQSPLASHLGCDTILAWAGGRDRLACVDNSSGESRLSFFDLNSNSDESLYRLPGLQDATFDFPITQYEGRKRVFSKMGRWFAFGSDEHAYTVNFDHAAPRLLQLASQEGSPETPQDLSFSPDGRFLAVQSGIYLRIWHLEPKHRGPLRRELANPIECGEEHYGAELPWCGTGVGGGSNGLRRRTFFPISPSTAAFIWAEQLPSSPMWLQKLLLLQRIVRKGALQH